MRFFPIGGPLTPGIRARGGGLAGRTSREQIDLSQEIDPPASPGPKMSTLREFFDLMNKTKFVRQSIVNALMSEAVTPAIQNQIQPGPGGQPGGGGGGWGMGKVGSEQGIA